MRWIWTLAMLGGAPVAAAQEPAPSPRSDGLSASAPTRAWVEGVGAAAFGTTRYGFGQLRGGGVLFQSKGKRASLAVNAESGLVSASVPDEVRGFIGATGVNGELWLLWKRPEQRGHHGFGIRGGGPPDYNGLFFLDHRDMAPHVSLFYDTVKTGEHLEGHLRIDIGVDGQQVAHLPLVGSLTWLPSSDLGLQFGFRGVGTLLQVGTLGLRLRTIESLEIGLGTILRLADLNGSGAHEGSPFEPMVSLKWSGSGVRKASPENMEEPEPEPEPSLEGVEDYDG